jgi:hypothetical protein
MRSHRHQPCLMVSPSQSAVLVPKLRLLGVRAVVASTLFLLSSPTGAQTRARPAASCPGQLRGGQNADRQVPDLADRLR